MDDRMPNLIEGKRCVVATVAYSTLQGDETHELVGVFETLDKFMEWKKLQKEQWRYHHTVCEVNRPLV